MRGVASGIFWGLVACAAAAVLVSLATVPPSGPGTGSVPPPAEEAPASQPPVLESTPAPDAAPSAPAENPPEESGATPTTGSVDLPPGTEFNRPPPEGEANLPGTDETAMPGKSPGVAMPASADMSPPAPDTAPAGQPEAGVATPEAMTAPDTGATAPGIAAAGEDPVLPGPAAMGPQVPGTEAQPQAPANPPAPAPSDQGTQRAAAPDASVPATDEERPDAMAEARPPETAGRTPPVEAGQPPSAGADVQPTPAPEAGTQPAQSDGKPRILRPDSAAEAGQGVIRVPVPGNEIAVPDVRTGRLPRVGDAPAAQEEAAAAPDSAQLGALARYAVPFTNEGNKPLFSVILIDAGDDGMDRAALTTFSFPVSFAVDASRPDADKAMRDYRAAGFEVILLAGGLPQGATPQDLEVSLNRYLSRMPETVAVMDQPDSALQTDRPLLRQLMAIVKETGQGVVTYDGGLNTAQQVARSEGVPSGVVFRMLDADRPSANTIERYLDRAAFKAGRDGHVVMVGHSYPETVKALFSWALQGKGQEVTMAPISAVLRGQ